MKRPGKKYSGIISIMLLGGIVLHAADLSAHTRNYVWTEQYRTIPKGEFEFEGWTTLKVPDGSVTNSNSIQYQGELEYGITDRWTISHYEAWETQSQPGDDDATVYDAFKFETKYRFGEKGKYWLDPLVYLEWETEPRDHDNPNTIEGKVVLSKDFGKFNVTYNQIMESKLGNGGRTEHAFSVGVSYEFPAEVRAGVEVLGQYWNPGSHRNEISVGPTLSLATKYFWAASGVAFGANREADDVQARLIVGVPF